MDIRLFCATKAFIVHEGKVLILREADTYEDGANIGKYDVVGGRVTPGERFDDSLLREIREETGLEATIGHAFHIDEWRPVVRDEQWHVIGTYIECHVINNTVQLGTDHDDYVWIDPKDHANYTLIESIHRAFDAYIEMKGI